MDNIQDTAQVAPTGQATPVEQVPSVQSPVETPIQPTDSSSEAPQPSQETSFDQLAAKKGFKSPDDLAKAYTNLESQNTRVAQQKADYERMFFTEQPQAQPTQTYQPAYQPPTDQGLQELRQFVDREAVQPLRQEYQRALKTEMAKIELQSVIKENTDFAKYAPEVKELKATYPDMSFKDAYTLAKAKRGDFSTEAKAQGLQEGTRYAEKQYNAQIVPPKRTGEGEVPPDDLLQNAGERWTISPRTSPAMVAKIRAEQAEVERRIFGRELN